MWFDSVNLVISSLIMSDVCISLLCMLWILLWNRCVVYSVMSVFRSLNRKFVCSRLRCGVSMSGKISDMVSELR